MLIGIDASRSFATAPTGTENYSRRIIDALLTAGSSHHFRLYTRTQLPPASLPETNNFQVRSIPFPRLWSHLRLSAELAVHPPDALFVPSHVLPLVHPRISLVTVHDLGYRYFPGAHRTLDRVYLDSSTRWNARAAQCVIADSEATRKDLIQFYGVPAEKIKVIYPALDEEWLGANPTPEDKDRVRTRYRITGDYILSVGTIQPRKNYARLIEALSTSPGDCRLVIAGKRGWLYRDLLESVREKSLENRVLFLDYVDRADLLALYAGARLMVMPSLYEGFGFPVLEAQACGTPVACSNTSSLPEVAGDAAEFFDPRDVASIRAGIQRLLHDDARRSDLTARGRENIRRFTWARAARQILDLFPA